MATTGTGLAATRHEGATHLLPSVEPPPQVASRRLLAGNHTRQQQKQRQQHQQQQLHHNSSYHSISTANRRRPRTNSVSNQRREARRNRRGGAKNQVFDSVSSESAEAIRVLAFEAPTFLGKRGGAFRAKSKRRLQVVSKPQAPPNMTSKTSPYAITATCEFLLNKFLEWDPSECSNVSVLGMEDSMMWNEQEWDEEDEEDEEESTAEEDNDDRSHDDNDESDDDSTLVFSRHNSHNITLESFDVDGPGEEDLFAKSSLLRHMSTGSGASFVIDEEPEQGGNDGQEKNDNTKDNPPHHLRSEGTLNRLLTDRALVIAEGDEDDEEDPDEDDDDDDEPMLADEEELLEEDENDDAEKNVGQASLHRFHSEASSASFFKSTKVYRCPGDDDEEEEGEESDSDSDDDTIASDPTVDLLNEDGGLDREFYRTFLLQMGPHGVSSFSQRKLKLYRFEPNLFQGGKRHNNDNDDSDDDDDSSLDDDTEFEMSWNTGPRELRVHPSFWQDNSNYRGVRGSAADRTPVTMAQLFPFHTAGGGTSAQSHRSSNSSHNNKGEGGSEEFLARWRASGEAPATQHPLNNSNNNDSTATRATATTVTTTGSSSTGAVGEATDARRSRTTDAAPNKAMRKRSIIGNQKEMLHGSTTATATDATTTTKEIAATTADQPSRPTQRNDAAPNKVLRKRSIIGQGTVPTETTTTPGGNSEATKRIDAAPSKVVRKKSSDQHEIPCPPETATATATDRGITREDATPHYDTRESST